MKFDIQKVKLGLGVYTKDGHGVRIVCTDVHNVGGTLSEYPIVGVVYNAKGNEEVHLYNFEGVPMDMPTNKLQRLVCAEEFVKWGIVECEAGIVFKSLNSLYNKKEDAINAIKHITACRDLRLAKVTFNNDSELWT